MAEHYTLFVLISSGSAAIILSMKAPLVMKFGGAAVATAGHFTQIAAIIEKKRKSRKKIVVVVSAMAGATDALLELAREVHPEPPQRELDMLVSVGERVSISLLAMALHRAGLEAVSFTGSQSGIITSNDHTEAKILEIRPHRLLPQLDAGRVIIVAGFQGVSRACEITTLGRGGSDTTAVALAVGLGADIVEFYKDVGGMYTSDPKYDEDAQLLSSVTHEQAEDIGGVLNGRAIALAKANGIALCIRGLDGEVDGTWIGRERAVSEEKVYEVP